MSDTIRRARELQRARASERATRAIVESAMLDLAAFATRAAANAGPFAAVNLDAFYASIATARGAAEEHASACARLAELEGPVNP